MDAATGDDDRACDALLMRVAGGDREALGQLFSREAGRLIGVARRIVRRTELAEEVVQESFVAMWKAAPRFDPARGRARAWMAAIVRNRSLNLVRDGSRLELADEATLAAFADASGEARAAFDALSEGDALRRCLETLDERKRDSILMAYVTGFTHGEIAARLGAPVGTIKAWIRRGAIALQECLS